MRNIDRKKTINEGLSAIVYHFTSTDALENIVKTNKFRATAVLGGGSDSRFNKGYFFFMSTTRNKFLNYNGSVCLVLDGNKLNQRYKGFSMEFFNVLYKKTNKSVRRSVDSEAEDRLVLNKPEIPNALDYILEVHINDYLFFGGDLISTFEVLEERGVPIYFYNNEINFLRQDKRKSIKPEFRVSEDYPKIVEETDKRSLFSFIYLLTIDNEGLRNKLLDYLGQEDKTKILDFFSSHEKWIDRSPIDSILVRYYENISRISADPNDLPTLVLGLMVREMRNNKIKDVRDYILHKLGPIKYE